MGKEQAGCVGYSAFHIHIRTVAKYSVMHGSIACVLRLFLISPPFLIKELLPPQERYRTASLNASFVLLIAQDFSSRQSRAYFLCECVCVLIEAPSE